MAAKNPLTIMPTMADDLDRVRTELAQSVQASDNYLTEIASHLVSAGGKLIRPGFCIAAAATAFADHQSANIDVVRGAASVELVHLGSLYHDDVIDNAETRHFVPSVNANWGNHKAILAGDFLLARASEIAASLGTDVAGLLAATIAELCEGQVLELKDTFNTDRTTKDFFASIDGKTASLLSASTRIGGLVGDLSTEHVELVAEFGRNYGLAFQIVDDILDLVATDEQLGKPAGNDMSEGVYTLAVIAALQGPERQELLELLVHDMSAEQRARAVAVVRGGPWVKDTIGEAQNYAVKAAKSLAQLEPSSGKTGLSAAADYLVESVQQAAAHVL